MLGDQCGWASLTRGPESLRSIMGLCGLIEKHSGTVLNAACEKALKSGSYRLKDIRRLIGEQADQTAFAFAQSHPLSATSKPTPTSSNHHRQSNTS